MHTAPPSDPWTHLGPVLSARALVARERLIERWWRHAPGLALRLSPQGPGVHERLGRTRFDLEVSGTEWRLGGALRGTIGAWPIADDSLALVVLDGLGPCLSDGEQGVLEEAIRVLAPEGRLVVIGPGGGVLAGSGQRRRCGPGSAEVGGIFRRAGLVEIEIQHALHWPPAPRLVLERWGEGIDRLGARLWPLLGRVYAVAARKPGNTVIAIPIARARASAGGVPAAEGMRRAG
jgi:SAM-dependent methyltransferase